MRQVRRVAVTVLAALSLAGCVGSMSREDFEDEVRSRGGGFSEQLVVDAVDAIARDAGTSDLSITRLTATPMAGTVSAGVRDPLVPENLDGYLVRNGKVERKDPTQVSVSVDLDEESFPISGFELDQLDEMADVALEEFDSEGAHVIGVAFVGVPSEDRTRTEGRVRFDLSSDRSKATATFTGGGRLVDLELQ